MSTLKDIRRMVAQEHNLPLSLVTATYENCKSYRESGQHRAGVDAKSRDGLIVFRLWVWANSRKVAEGHLHDLVKRAFGGRR